MDLSSWPQVGMINQKNYYTEFLKRDEQFLAVRYPKDEERARIVQEARDKDRARALGVPQASEGATPHVDDAATAAAAAAFCTVPGFFTAALASLPSVWPRKASSLLFRSLISLTAWLSSPSATSFPMSARTPFSSCSSCPSLPTTFLASAVPRYANATLAHSAAATKAGSEPAEAEEAAEEGREEAGGLLAALVACATGRSFKALWVVVGGRAALRAVSSLEVGFEGGGAVVGFFSASASVLSDRLATSVASMYFSRGASTGG